MSEPTHVEETEDQTSIPDSELAELLNKLRELTTVIHAIRDLERRPLVWWASDGDEYPGSYQITITIRALVSTHSETLQYHAALYAQIGQRWNRKQGKLEPYQGFLKLLWITAGDGRITVRASDGYTHVVETTHLIYVSLSETHYEFSGILNMFRAAATLLQNTKETSS